jgi:phosphatidylglycerophosphate synthase
VGWRTLLGMRNPSGTERGDPDAAVDSASGSQPVIEQIAALRYDCRDASILLPWLSRWLFLPGLRLVPARMSANVLTLTANLGTLLTLGAMLLGRRASSSLPHVLAAIGTLWNMLIDNIDGAQARRTGTSSPLGEFFDHWSDAFNTPFMVIAYGYGMACRPELIFLVLTLSCLAYYAACLEQLRTGVVVMGPIGPLEGLVITFGMYTWAAATGPAWWRVEQLCGFTRAELFAWFAAFSYAANVVPVVRRHWRYALALTAPLILSSVLGLGSLLGGIAAPLVYPAMVLAVGLAAGRVLVARVTCAPLRVFDPVLLAPVVAATVVGVALGDGGAEVPMLLLAAYMFGLVVFDFVRTTRILTRALGIDLRGRPVASEG